ncbi:MAG: type II toxin-antitoxin system VapC family toxin [Candidatus Omnitrophica bacterium]|nr:type II toxin-antitoxin system VapC family toxin [Candidatus Omnitrophota bacterium]
MKVIRVYVDTSVIGGCCDSEFQEWSYGLLADFQVGVFSLLLSELVDAEVQEAPDEVKDVYAEFRRCAGEVLELTPDAIELAESYLNHNILPLSFRSDARHIAIATVAGADLLVSWNFKHIVHFEKIQKFNAVNIEMGYKPILIYSPREVTRYGGKSR